MKIATIISITAKSPVDEKLARARPFAVIEPSIIVPKENEYVRIKYFKNIFRLHLITYFHDFPGILHDYCSLGILLSEGVHHLNDTRGKNRCFHGRCYGNLRGY